MRCPSCDHEVPEGQRFCGNCGRRMAPPEQAAAAPPPADTEAPIPLSEPEPAARGPARPPGDSAESVFSVPDTTEPGGEREVWHGRFSNRSVIGGLVLTFIVLLALGVVMLIGWWRYSWDRTKLIVAGVVGVVLGVLGSVWALWPWFKYRFTRRYRLTGERLFIDRGFLSRTRDEIELTDIDDVRVKQSLLDRVFRVGDVYLLTTEDQFEAAEQKAGKGGRKERAAPEQQVLIGVDEPDAVKEKIRHCVSQRRKKVLHVERL